MAKAKKTINGQVEAAPAIADVPKYIPKTHVELHGKAAKSVQHLKPGDKASFRISGKVHSVEHRKQSPGDLAAPGQKPDMGQMVSNIALEHYIIEHLHDKGAADDNPFSKLADDE